MKKRITCMLLALCMVLAAVPAAVAAPVVKDQIDLSRLAGVVEAEAQRAESTVLPEAAFEIADAAATPMTDSGYAMYWPNTLGMSCKAGSAMDLRALIYVPVERDQKWYMAIYAGEKLTEDNIVGGASDTLSGMSGFFDLSVTVDTEELEMKPGTYTAVYLTTVNGNPIDGTAVGIRFYVTESEVALKRVYFTDISVEGYPEIKTLCVSRGSEDISTCSLRVDPEKATVNRQETYTSSSSALEVDSVAGRLGIVAKEYGVFQVTGQVAGKSATLSVEVCNDEYGHTYRDVVDLQPTCTAAGSQHRECSKCGYWVSQSSIPALGHSWDAGKITKEETEEAWGEKLYTCTRCGATKTAPYHTCPGAIFTDMPKDDNWSHKGIDYCVKNGLMNGMGNNRFQPFLNTTRAQLVTVLWRMAGSPEPESEAPFEDLKIGSFYEKAVTWGYENGIVKGVTETAFSPNSSLTREQMATFFYRYAEKILKVDVSARKDITSFPDYDKILEYSKDCLSWACAVELINGVPNGSVIDLQPKGSATRAQLATVLMRFCENIVPELPATPEVPEVPEA